MDYDPSRNTPYDEDYPCDVCGGWPDSSCICPECPECGSIGDPWCYEEGHLTLDRYQVACLDNRQSAWEQANARDCLAESALDLGLADLDI